MPGIRWSDLGFPNVQGRRTLAAAAAVDSLGSGIFLPFSILYFLNSTSLSVTSIGLALSTGTVLALPTSPVIGPFVDRLGPRSITIASNVVQAAGFACYLLVMSAWQLVIFSFLVNLGQNAFWTANGSLVTLAADPGERTRWFGMMRSLRNAGYGAGGLLASVAVAGAGQQGFRLIIVVNALTFVGAALLTASWRPSRATGLPSGEVHTRGGRLSYRVLLAERSFRLTMAVNVLFVLCNLVLTVVLAVYTTVDLKLPGWIPGTLFTLATVLVIVGQIPVTRCVEARRRTPVLRLAAALWALSFAMLWALSIAPPIVALVGVFVAVVVYTAAEIVYSPVMADLVAAMSTAETRGRYFAVQQLTWGVARSVAPAAFLFLLDRGDNWLWTALIGCSAVAVLLLFRLSTALGDTDLPDQPAEHRGL